MNPRELIRGTPEAREYMARLRAMRGKRGRPTEVFGYPLDPVTLTPIRPSIDVRKSGDYGADPVEGGMFRMIPSGDIVDAAERARRLGNHNAPLGKGRAPNAPQTGTRAALRSMAAALGLSVDTYSPGDGVTRYRFFPFPGGDYFAHSHQAVGTVKGLKRAFKFLEKYRRGVNPPMLVIGNPVSPTGNPRGRKRKLSPDDPFWLFEGQKKIGPWAKRAIENHVDRLHVSVPESEVEREIREIGARSGAPEWYIEEAVKIALNQHRENRALYAYVMGGGAAGAGEIGTPRNPVSAPVDPDAVRELILYIENTYELVGAPNSQGVAIRANLARKWYAGTYDREKAVNLWAYLVESGARRYLAEFGTPGAPIDTVFNKNTRLEVARYFRDDFERRMQGGEFDPAWVRSVVPRKYHGKLPNPPNLMGNPRRAKRDPIEAKAEQRGVRIVYLPVNQAWLVVWGTEGHRLAGPFNARWEAVEYVEDLMRGVNPHEITDPPQSFDPATGKWGPYKWGKGVARGVLQSVHPTPGTVTIDGTTFRFMNIDYHAAGSSYRAYKALLGLQKHVGKVVEAQTTHHPAFGWVIFNRRSIRVVGPRATHLNPGVRSPWAVCTAAVGREDRAKFERCVRAVKRMNPSLPPAIASDPGFKKALKMYRRIHGSGPVEVRKVSVPPGVRYPKYLVAYGKAPAAFYDAPRHSRRGKRVHHFGEGGGTQPWLVTAPGKRKFLAYVGGSFRAGNWIYK